MLQIERKAGAGTLDSSRHGGASYDAHMLLSEGLKQKKKSFFRSIFSKRFSAIRGKFLSVSCVCMCGACTLSCLFASCCCCCCCCRSSDSDFTAAACLYAKSRIENENVRTVFRTVAFSLCSSARLSYLIQFFQFQFSKAPPLPLLPLQPSFF